MLPTFLKAKSTYFSSRRFNGACKSLSSKILFLSANKFTFSFCRSRSSKGSKGSSQYYYGYNGYGGPPGPSPPGPPGPSPPGPPGPSPPSPYVGGQSNTRRGYMLVVSFIQHILYPILIVAWF